MHDLATYVCAETGLKKDRFNKVLGPRLKNVELIDRPDKAYGLDPTNKIFNIYRWNRSQTVFYEPETYKENYTYPETTLRALELTIGKHLYTRYLPFFNRKLTTRDHSPLVFVNYGVPHSMKSAQVNGIWAPLFHQRVKMMDSETFTDKFNDWQINTDIVLIDEAHHLLDQDRKKMIKMMNTITGNDIISGVRGMHKSFSGDTLPQEITVFITTNQTMQLTSETKDRRMVVFTGKRAIAAQLGMSNTEFNRLYRQNS